MRIFADSHPKAQVRNFCRVHRLNHYGLANRGCSQILNHILSIPDLKWAGQQPPAYRLSIDMRGVNQPFLIFPHDEPADEAAAFCREFNLPQNALDSIITHLCGNGQGSSGKIQSMCTRREPKKTLFTFFINTEDGEKHRIDISNKDSPQSAARMIRQSFCLETTPRESDACNSAKVEALMKEQLEKIAKQSVEPDPKVFDGNDLFAILGLQKAAETANPKELKAAFKKLSLMYHPDKCQKCSTQQKSEAQDRFIKVAHAYETLTDPALRGQYLRTRNQNNPQMQQQQQPSMHRAMQVYQNVFHVKAGQAFMVGGISVSLGAGAHFNVNGVQVVAV